MYIPPQQQQAANMQQQRFPQTLQLTPQQMLLARQNPALLQYIQNVQQEINF